MPRAKVTITLEQETLRQVDSLVARRVFPSRSRAIQTALREKIDRLEVGRLATECAKLDPAFERALAEEGLGADTASGLCRSNGSASASRESRRPKSPRSSKA
jgi:Arc/MetJ-type ribon-helix-helix transcriptional regulator